MTIHAALGADARHVSHAAHYLEMEEPVRQVSYLADALDRIVWYHKDQGDLPLSIYREIDAVLSAMRAEHAKVFGIYEGAAS